MSASVCGQAGMPAMHVTGGDEQDHNGAMNRGAGPWLVALGALLVVLGLLAWTGLLSWFGRLPCRTTRWMRTMASLIVSM